MFIFFNSAFMAAISMLCLLPMINVLAISFSSKIAAAAGEVNLWPVDFQLTSYWYVLRKPEFLRAFGVSVQRVILGLCVNMVLIILAAYPLSKEKKDFHFRGVYVWFFVFTMLFGGGLIPLYMVVRAAGLLDSIWALILPGALPVYNTVILLNFFRGLSKELSESAFMDGAGHWTILWRIYVPLSLPSLATLSLFVIVGHWNSWFDGMIYMNSTRNQPLQTYMQQFVVQSKPLTVSKEYLKMLEYISDRTVKSAQIFIGALPVLAVYPFMQRYFIKGLVMGSVKE